MSLLDLSRINLNLLVCLHVLLQEQSVSLAAKRLYLSQSAISKNLSQLRQLTGDPLFVRQTHGLMPTSYALSLKSKLAAILVQIDVLLQPPEFDPATVRCQFTLAIPTSGSQMLFHRLVPKILQQAPYSVMELKNIDEDVGQQLLQGGLDLLLLPSDLKHRIDGIQGLYIQPLYQERLACLLRKEHPCLTQTWDLDAYLNLRHINVGPLVSSPTIVIERLKQMGLERDCAASVEDFYSATYLCEMTDLVFTCTQSWANTMTQRHQLEQRPLPLELPAVEFSLYWHKRKNHDLAHQWLRQQFFTVANELSNFDNHGDHRHIKPSD